MKEPQDHIDPLDYWEKLTTFLEEWLNIPESFYMHGKILLPDKYHLCLNFLLVNGVFEDANELQWEAYRDYKIFITEHLITGEEPEE